MAKGRTGTASPGRFVDHRRRWFVVIVAVLLGIGAIAFWQLRGPHVPHTPVIALPSDVERFEPEFQALLKQQYARIEAQPSEATEYAELALIYEANKLWPEAREAFDAALSLDAQNRQWKYHLAVATSEAGDLETAYTLLAELSNEAPTFAPAQHRWGQACLEHGDYENATKAFRKVIQLAPEAAEGYVGLADVHLRTKQVEQAIHELKLALARDNTYKVAHFLLGRALQQQGKTQASQQELERGQGARVRYLPDDLTRRSERYAVTNLARYQRSLDLMQKGEMDAAIQTLQELLRADPNHVSALNLLAGAYMQTNRPEDALQLLEKAKDVDGEKYTTYINLASWYLNDGQLDVALTHAQKAIELADWVMTSHYLRLEILLRLQRTTAFRSALDEARRVSSNDPQLTQYEARWRRQIN